MTATEPAAAVGERNAWPLPQSRGPLGAALLRHLTGHAPAAGVHGTDLPHVADAAVRHAGGGGSLLRDDDVQLSLALLYELSFQGVAGVDDTFEDDEAVAAVRRSLETALERALREVVRGPEPDPGPNEVVERIWAMTAPSSKPGLTQELAQHGTAEQFREIFVHRSLYQLREADVHTLAVPRLPAPTKAALLEVQWDEYGAADTHRMHSRLFARTMRALGLDDRYGHYVDHVPAVTLAALNALSLFGRHRRLLGELVGDLCAIETTSSLPSKAYAAGLRRLGFGADATTFYTEHVEADSVHEQICVRDLAGRLVADEPRRADGVLFGVACHLSLEDLMFEHITEQWEAGRSSLRLPLR